MATTNPIHLPAGEGAGHGAATPVALGPDLVMYKGSRTRVVLYHTGVGLLGTFEDPAAAWSALDAIDMPDRIIAGE